jgi:ribose transport system substrate-binding protein
MGGKGDLVILNGPQATSVMARVEGCKESLAKYPAITIVADQQGDASRDQGFSSMQTLMTRFAEIDGVFAINDNMAIGAELAARQARRSGIKIAEFDGSPDLLQALKTSDMIIGSASQDPYALGMKAAQVSYDIMNGQLRPEQFISQPSGLVNRENVDKYPGWRQ